MSAEPPSWFDKFLGVAYRYYDLRMNVVPLFQGRDIPLSLWQNVIYWWVDPSIKIRFIEDGDDYWFVMGSETQRPEDNLNFFKLLPQSESYERFKRGHGGEAYLRLGVYARQDLADAKKDALCDCGHDARDHDEGDGDVCLYIACDCKKFSSFQVTLLKRKKTVTDIRFMTESQVKDDPLAWNCLNANKYKRTGI